jgi:hypothetical protein
VDVIGFDEETEKYNLVTQAWANELASQPFKLRSKFNDLKHKLYLIREENEKYSRRTLIALMEMEQIVNQLLSD